MKKQKYMSRNNEIYMSDEQITRRVLLCVPMTGLVRAEWMLSRYGQMIPTNWSHGEIIQWMDMFIPLGHPVADARNCAAKAMIEGGWEWLFFIDHDVILPLDTFSKWNIRMQKKDVPIFGGLYFTKSQPAEPLVYREWGESYFTDWKLGDEVWVRGMGNGCTVYHRSIIEQAWKEAEEYVWAGNKTRMVWKTPQTAGLDPVTGLWRTSGGTEDIYFFDKVIQKGFLEKAGWSKIAKKKYPFLCDTSVFCKHIDVNGKQYPANGEEKQYMGK